jgi:hypothetical protein
MLARSISVYTATLYLKIKLQTFHASDGEEVRSCCAGSIYAALSEWSRPQSHRISVMLPATLKCTLHLRGKQAGLLNMLFSFPRLENLPKIKYPEGRQ